MTFAIANLERWTADEGYSVTPQAVSAFEAAINDVPVGEPRGATELTPPTFAVVPALPRALAAIREVWSLDRNGYDTRAVHGEHRIEFMSPMRLGMNVITRAATVGIVPKRTGTLLITHTETRDEQTADLLNRMWFVNYLRDVHADQDRGAPSPIATLESEAVRQIAAVSDFVDQDQSFRYAEASGDDGPYHVSEEVARAAGFDGVIVHGLCLLALAAKALVSTCCAGDPRRLRNIEARFSAPLYPGQAITTSVWEAQRAGAYGFLVADANGTIVLKRGRAEVSP